MQNNYLNRHFYQVSIQFLNSYPIKVFKKNLLIEGVFRQSDEK